MPKWGCYPHFVHLRGCLLLSQAIIFPVVYVDFVAFPLAVGLLLLGLALEGMQLLFILLQG